MSDTAKPENRKKESKEIPSNTTGKFNFKYLIGAVVGIAFLVVGYFGYLYASSPSHIRYPEFAHYHFRTQLIVDGNPVDFSDDSFQQEYDSASCSADLPEQPIDFHDNADQMTHIHWTGITGGEFLKYYGWNFIGGKDNSLGLRYDIGNFVSPVNVPIYGSPLPELPENADYFVYVGDETAYESRSWQTFLNSDLEVLFSDSTSLNGAETSRNPLDIFFAKAYAHGAVEDSDEAVPATNETEEQRLERINTLAGNVVIFAQDQAPTVEEIQERFNNLAPLQDSVCGG